MPRLSTSDRAKARAAHLLERLIAYANHELPDREFSPQFVTRWSVAANQPILIVQAKLSELAALIAPGKLSQSTREHIRHDLRLFREFLGILEDNRTKTQGTEIWHFTLKLWHRSTQQNLVEFEREWQARKLQQSQSRRANLSTVSLEVSSEVSAASAAEPLPASVKIYQNLPARQHTALIGLKPQLTRLLDLLATERPALINLTGAGGIGKTTLALEVAHRCWLASQNSAASEVPTLLPTFGAIIFISAKSQHFVGTQLSARLKLERSLRDILRVILRTLTCFEAMPLDLAEQIELVQAVLARQRTLLILDNLETLTEPEPVLSFFSELPATVKVIVTSRTRSGLGTAIELSYLSLSDSLELIQHYAQEKGIVITPAQAQLIYQKTGGLPLAMVYVISQIAVYDLAIEPAPFDSVQSDLVQSDLVQSDLVQSDLIQYCFAEMVQPLKAEPTYALLLTLALLTAPASVETLEQIAFGQAEVNVANSLGRLYKLSLIESDQGRYDLHPLTRTYMRNELAMNPEFEQTARERWVNWYLALLQPISQQNWRDWQGYASLEPEWENIREVLEWCKTQNRYQEFKQLWQCLKGYTQNYGHWHERLDWMDWLIAAAEQRADTAALADALYHASRTLYLFNQPEQSQRAITLSQQAWQLSLSQSDWILQTDLTIHLASLYAQQQQFDQAWDWLTQGEALLQQFDQPVAHLDLWINVDYYKAEICFHNQDYSQAKQLYTQALHHAEAIEWQRAIVYIKGGLAVIAIAQNNLEEAESLLNDVLLQAERHQDKRCLSFCQSYLAQLEQARGNGAVARHWAELARDNFNTLQMKTKAAEMDALLED